MSKEHFSDRKIAKDVHGFTGTMQKISYKNSPTKKGFINRGAILAVDGYSTMHETIPKIQEKNQSISYGKSSISGSSLMLKSGTLTRPSEQNELDDSPLKNGYKNPVYFHNQHNSNVSIREIVEPATEVKDQLSPQRCSKLQLYKLKSS